jgi:hypothetical protein
MGVVAGFQVADQGFHFGGGEGVAGFNGGRFADTADNFGFDLTL